MTRWPVQKQHTEPHKNTYNIMTHVLNTLYLINYFLKFTQVYQRQISGPVELQVRHDGDEVPGHPQQALLVAE